MNYLIKYNYFILLFYMPNKILNKSKNRKGNKKNKRTKSRNLKGGRRPIILRKSRLLRQQMPRQQMPRQQMPRQQMPRQQMQHVNEPCKSQIVSGTSDFANVEKIDNNHYRVSGANYKEVNGIYSLSNIPRYVGTVTFSKLGEPHMNIIRWEKKHWMIIDMGPMKNKFPGRGGKILYKIANSDNIPVIGNWPQTNTTAMLLSNMDKEKQSINNSVNISNLKIENLYFINK